MPTVGILLAGCGRYDGSEVHETVLLHLELLEQGCRVLFIAPDRTAADLVDHSSADLVEGTPGRNMLDESARLAGGRVEPLESLSAGKLDALVIPGGAGVVKNFCEEGHGRLGGGRLREDVAELLAGLAGRKAPLACTGLAGVVLARHLERPLDDMPVTARCDRVDVSEDGRVLYSPGMMAAGSVTELAVSMKLLVAELKRSLEDRG